MEYVESRSPRERINESGALPSNEVPRHGTQAADGLAYPHEHDVAHRDLKAANAMIRPTAGSSPSISDSPAEPTPRAQRGDARGAAVTRS
jgi:serine/threonine protein kinase